MRRIAIICLLALSGSTIGRAGESNPLLLQRPTVNRTYVAFVYGDDLWMVGRQGGDARRLTSGMNADNPHFSPDGAHLAFTAEAHGNQDVYVMPASGGVARRLTYHPGTDRVVGWTPDSKQILFASGRSSYHRFERLFTIPLEGGFPSEVPLPIAFEGSYSPDGSRLAYVPLPGAFTRWKRYRGGRATPVWIADLKSGHIEKVPRTDSNDFNPMWVGGRVYFLSDRNGPFTLFAYDPKDKQVTQVLANEGLDIKSAAAGPDVIVYEQFGSLHLLDPETGATHEVPVRIPADLPDIRPRFEKVAKQIQNADISPSGARAVFEAHGEIFTVPAEKGDVRNLTNSPTVADRAPAWSPDGRSIAYFSDETGEYQLHVRDARASGPAKKFALGKASSFYYTPVWSPDSKKIAYGDECLQLWVLDLGTGKNSLVDAGTYLDDTPTPVWSPGSRWLAYTKQLKSAFHAIFAYSLEKGARHQLTDGMSDVRDLVFDKNGKYLYFTASTDVGQGAAGTALDMAVIGRPITQNVYVMLLREDLPSPLAPQSDEEKEAEAPMSEMAPAKVGSAEKKTPGRDEAKKTEAVRIDPEDINQRILALPLEPRRYTDLQIGKPGVLFVLEGTPARIEIDQARWPSTLHKFDLEKLKTEKFIEGVKSFRVTHNGEKLLYEKGDQHFIVSTAQVPKSGEGALHLDGLELRVDPRAEWRQMYHEVWRIERDFLYDPGFHGLDLKATEKKYEPYLDGLASRRDLNYLFGEMLGELTLGHVYINDPPSLVSTPTVKVGLLGADYRIENGRYRFEHIYRGENWNPKWHGPLLQPGAQVKEGEYLLAVNGQELRAPENVYKLFEGTAGKSVVLKVGPHPDGRGARTVMVVPVDNERSLRYLSWVDENRRKVDRLSDGRVAYIYVPDTYLDGFARFTRYLFPQSGKEAAVIDERFNGGGIMPDYIIEALQRKPRSYVATRHGHEWVSPNGAICGPKVMITNEFAGSGGDILPYYFRQEGVGPLLGKRTWGGAVGIGAYPKLLDGGGVTAPKAAFWFPSGRWEIENHGVDPDIEVEFDPEAVRAGHDPQLEKAVTVALDQLEKHPITRPQRPPYPNYHQGKPNGKRAKGGPR
jgi:tricorn protease